MAMSNLGAGLLGFASGALGAAEGAYQTGIAQANKMSLEEYKFEKQKEIESLRHKYAGSLATTAADRAAKEAQLDRDAQDKRNRDTIAGAKDRAEIAAEDRKAQKQQVAAGRASLQDTIEDRATGAVYDLVNSALPKAYDLTLGEESKDINSLLRLMEKNPVAGSDAIIAKIKEIQRLQQQMDAEAAKVQPEEGVSRFDQLQTMFDESLKEMLGDAQGLLGTPKPAGQATAPAPQPAAVPPPPGFKLLGQ